MKYRVTGLVNDAGNVLSAVEIEADNPPMAKLEAAFHVGGYWNEDTTVEPVDTTGHYWERYTCDACGKPFTLEEWDARETPHNPDCPNYDPDDDDEHVNCTCDRNYHSQCWNWEEPDMIVGERCQSTSHDRGQCWGELWQCDECRQWVCHADGTDDGTSDYLLCDACWAKKHEGA